MKRRPFFGARLDDFVTRHLGSALRRAGWRPRIVPFTGLGTPSRVRVLGQLVLGPARRHRAWPIGSPLWLNRRGWRNFFTVPVPNGVISVTISGRAHRFTTDRRGHLDTTIDTSGLAAGWHQVRLDSPGAEQVGAPVQVIGDDQDFGIISDIDDTIISTSLPRPLVAAWNSFIQPEVNRQAVPGMARMYRQLLAGRPDAPVVYVSTGPWTALPFLTRFMDRHGFPPGPMLLTDLGPTTTRWLRSGCAHKRAALVQLAHAFPHIRWVLVGDNGQHDQALYREFAAVRGSRVRAIAIRTLSPTEQVLAHGTVGGLDTRSSRRGRRRVPEVLGADGQALAPVLLAVLREQQHGATGPDQPTDPGH
ncbi:App1 family protein [Propionibacterium freudenreichii]|uniref:PF09949 family protein n=4 Tax=Propionibacterium freudenreichii TaxID=1744 RepID=A0A2C7Z5X3_9ACTN|nr:phosphatase domain-containing protein [Propionibacterium freudenreichii]CEP25845.1 Hypothetical protein PFCIRM138_02675 [Propionibacterium freudenreichii subsp. freudenreichii]MCT2973859.1 DUF2183 domain-containing protein [Propionibacterium freudenreichii]MCT2975648.1 DUF2183 domain-containing protein [Propionibacterium freudenreichii]MCT2977918.1 DUF2183 domain-containing protein [Propionibacterium freudenreichii]MCT2984856.1 DUF2183 domain-containing protein [Propionibacterium freudenrei